MERNRELNYAECKKCGSLIKYQDTDAWWDYSMMSYNVKLVKCPTCGCIHIIECEDVENERKTRRKRYY